jgi:hypothetical protein
MVSKINIRKERILTHSSKAHALDVAKEVRQTTGHKTRVAKKKGRYSIYEYY